MYVGNLYHSLIKIEQDDKTSLIVFLSLTFISKVLLQKIYTTLNTKCNYAYVSPSISRL